MANLKTGTDKAMRGPRTLAALTAALLLSTAAACSSPEQKVEKYTQSGMEFLEQGDLGRANVQFQNALKIDEDHIPALEGFARLLEERQDYRAMFGTLQRIRRLDPQNVMAHVKLGQIYLIGSDETAALESAEEALKLAPDNADALALKAAVLLKLDDEAGAVELAARALEIDPQNTEATAVLATERSKAGDNEAALAEVEKAIAGGNDAAVLHLLRLQLLGNLGREDQLMSGFRELIAQHPDNVGFRQMYANLLINEEDLAGAREQMVEIVRVSPDKLEPMLDVVRIDYRMSGAEAATKTFQSYIDERPDNHELKFMFAAFLRQQNDVAGAEAIYEGLAAKKDSQSVALRARDEVAGLRLAEGDVDAARAIVDSILSEDAQHPGALVKRAGLKIEAADYDSAIADLRTVIDAKPDMTAAKLLMASALEQKGDQDLAAREFAQVVQDTENAAQPSLLFARFLMRRGQNERAEKVLLDSVGVNPNAVENLRLLAAIRLARQDWKGAEEIATLIERADGDDASVNRIIGVARTGLQDYAGAIDALSAANSQTPLASRPLATLVNAYMKEGRSGEAESLLSGMIGADDDNYTARLLYAQVLGAQEKADEMETALKAALEAAPERSEAAQALFRYYMAQGRYDEIEQMLQSSMADAPNVDDFKVLYADLLLTTDRRQQALDMYEDILTRRPDDELVANNYASLVLELRDDRESLERALQVARALEGSEIGYFVDTLGWAQYRNGAYEDAVRTLERAVEANPDFAESLYHLGAAYLAVGETEKGRAHLESAVSKAPDAPFAAKARELLAGN